jgi:hypothetical protein
MPRPVDQLVRSVVRAHLLTEAGQLFAQVERRAQLRDRLLPGSDRRGCRGFEQPAGERPLADARARRAEQLEERSLAEQVEVVGVGVVRIEEALAAAALPRPALLEPRQAGLVEGGRPLGLRAAPDQPVVDARRDDEGDDRQQDPGPGDRTRHHHRPQQDRRDGEDREAHHRQPQVGASQGAQLGPAALQALPVDGLGGGALHGCKDIREQSASSLSGRLAL